MRLGNRIQKLEDKMGNKKKRTIIYGGKKPDIQDPNVEFWDLGDSSREEGDWWFEASDLTHEEWLEIMELEDRKKEGASCRT